MKTLERVEKVNGLLQKVLGLQVELDLAKGTKGVTAVKEELFRVAQELDEVMIQGSKTHLKAVKRQVKQAGKLRVGVRHSLSYLEVVIQEHLAYLKSTTDES